VSDENPGLDPLALLIRRKLPLDRAPTNEEIIDALKSLEAEGKITKLVLREDGFTCTVVPPKEEQS
jgi:hypothetical protein